MFQCKLCGRTYISKFSLHLHINNFHKGIKRYSCEYCDKTYAQKHNLKIHLKSVHKKDINEGSKNFLDDSPKISQDVNNQKFSSENEGTKNINVTTTANSPPDLKLASFGTAFTKTTDNAEKMNKCHICDKEFDQDQLEIHFLTSHSMEDEEDTKENIHEESKQLIEMKKVDEGNTPAKIKEPNVDDSIFPNNLTTQNVPYKSQENISQDVHEGSTNSSNVSITKSIHEGLKFQSQEFISPNVHEGSKNLSNVNVTKSNHNGLNFQSQKIISPNVHEGSKDSMVSQSVHDGFKLLFKHSSDMDVNIPRFGKDLFAINIARGRDHGIPSYAQFYEKFGPKTDFDRSMKCWQTRPKSFNSQFWDILKNTYICPKDIDLFVGGLLEAKTNDQGVLGSIFGWIVAEQFQRLRDGDRFFFTHTGSSRLKMYALVRENIFPEQYRFYY